MNTTAAPAETAPAPAAAPRFVHLRLHTEFSVQDGIVQIGDALGMAADDGMVALGMSDLGNLFGMVKFYKAARSKGVKPIIGADVWLGNEAAPDKPFRLLLICRNRAGYGQLCELLTRAYMTNQTHGRAELRREWLSAEAVSGLLCLSGAVQGDIGAALLSGNTAQAEALAQDWAARFPDAFYLEIQRTGRDEDERHVQAALALAARCELPVVATHPVQFLRADDFEAHEARVCIAQGNVLDDARRPHDFTAQQYFKTQAQMGELFADLPEALENTLEIARRASLTLQLGKPSLPQFPTPEGMSLDDFLVQQAREGLEERLAVLYPDAAEREQQRARYEERLRFELDTIIQMGFPGYFLIVADFINWAKRNDVPVGPGRGSGAGSLVAYCLRITDLDPLAYALLFERFLNPERVSMPDFDIDFCQDKRYQVIEYVRQRYGSEAVSQIATFGTMASKAVVRDVGRVLGMSYGLCDRLSKLIPLEGPKPVSLARAYDLEPQIGEMMEDEGDGDAVRELWRLAQPLEGLCRNVGMHAGGVLIAPGKLTDFCPVYLADGHDAVPVSQFDKDDVEAIGLVKFDFLGLRNLTIIDLALRYIERMEGARPDLMAMPFTDPATYQILKDANTTAVFQVESEGMKRLLQKLGPDRFEDIIAVLALYRPGPLGSGMVDDFILRKKGQQSIDYFHPALQACLEPTYGVIVYQEQVMQISQIIGGYTLGGADMLRRAMGKKKAEEMARHREIMRKGARENGYDESLAMQLFDLMEKFAEYGFNKSHTAAYAVLTYQTAWLKAHHCAAFMAATMSSDMDNTDTVKVFYEDATSARNGLTVEAPDVNVGQYFFEPIDRTRIRYGLGAIKGVGRPAVEAILAAREAGGAFRDLFDFCQRIDRHQANRRVCEALIRAGALDALPGHAKRHRAELLANLNAAFEAADQAAAHAGQGGLFDDLPEAESLAVAWTPARPWDARRRLQEEKTAIGFYLSGHPFQAFREEARHFAPRPLKQLTVTERGATTRLAGIVMNVRTRMGNRGKMAFVTLDDGSAAHEVCVYAETLEAFRGKIVTDNLLVVEGKVSQSEFNGETGFRIVADRLLDLADARAGFAAALTCHINLDELPAPQDFARRLHEQLAAARCEDGTPLRFCCECTLPDAHRARAHFPAHPDWRLRLDETTLSTLREALPECTLRIDYTN